MGTDCVWLPACPYPNTNQIELKNMPESQPLKNTLAIWALVFAVLCSLVGLILGIIGLNKYPDKSNGKTMSLIAVVVSIVLMLVGGLTAAGR